VVNGETTRWSTLVNPERAIPEFIQHLTGIRDDMVADAPLFAEVAEKLRATRRKSTDCWNRVPVLQVNSPAKNRSPS